MPIITRSTELLNMTDGLYFVDNEVIDIASHLHIELKAISSNFGEDAIKNIVPHIAKVMNQLNAKFKQIHDLEKELQSISRDLDAAENRVQSLNCSFRDKSIECNVLEDESTEIISELRKQCKELTDQNVALSSRIKDNVHYDIENFNKLISDNQVKIQTMTEERKCLLTTIEVLEAELGCLRTQIVGLEARASSPAEPVLTHLPAAPSETPLTDVGEGPDDLCGGDSSGCCNEQYNVTLEAPKASKESVGTRDNTVLIIGDSLVRQASLNCVYKGALLECCPGARIVHIKERLLNYVNQDLSIIHFHVGTNNLRKGYRGGPGYDGGHGKKQVLHSMADLLFTTKTHFPNSKVFVNSILIRSDISYKALFDFNSQLEIMCDNFGVTFVEANCWVARRDLGRDGRHLNRRGVARFAALFEEVMEFGLKPETECTAAVPSPSSADPNPQTPPFQGNGQ